MLAHEALVYIQSETRVMNLRVYNHSEYSSYCKAELLNIIWILMVQYSHQFNAQLIQNDHQKCGAKTTVKESPGAY